MSCTHTGQHQPGRLPYPEALPRRPGPCAAQGLRRAGLSPQAVHCVGHGFRVRGCPPSAESPRFLRADFARLVRFWDPLRRRRRPEASSPGAPRQAPAAASPSRRAFACWDGLLYRLSPRCDCLCVPGALQTQVLLRWADISAVTNHWVASTAVEEIRAHLPDLSAHQGRPPAATAGPPAALLYHLPCPTRCGGIGAATGATGAPPPIPSAGFTVEAAPPGELGTALVGRTVL